MIFARPSYKIENQLRKRGFEMIVGADEAGRGAWAGPVVAAAVVLPVGLKIKGLADSKLLRPEQREKLFTFIKNQALKIGVGVVSEKVIDSEGIIPATRQAFLAAIGKIEEAMDYLLVDGIKIFEHHLPVEFIIKGDRKIATIAAASIIAKVTRDKLLEDYGREYPHYGFERHKGYGTEEHWQNLFQYGPCEIHRKSFEPIINIGKICLEDDFLV
jgi:ribonuclease HII